MSADLVVVTGLPGTGKTTLARSLSVALGAPLLRVDAAETAIETVTGAPAGVAGYAVVRQLARTNLLLGLPVVVDAVRPVPAARAGWRALADEAGARAVLLETRLDDVAEHRRRVEERRPDMAGQRVPTWSEVAALEYVPWDVVRDGERVRVDTADRDDAVRAAPVAARA